MMMMMMPKTVQIVHILLLKGVEQYIKCNALRNSDLPRKAQLLGNGKRPWTCECIENQFKCNNRQAICYL